MMSSIIFGTISHYNSNNNNNNNNNDNVFIDEFVNRNDTNDNSRNLLVVGLTTSMRILIKTTPYFIWKVIALPFQSVWVFLTSLIAAVTLYYVINQYIFAMFKIWYLNRVFNKKYPNDDKYQRRYRIEQLNGKYRDVGLYEFIHSCQDQKKQLKKSNIDPDEQRKFKIKKIKQDEIIRTGILQGPVQDINPNTLRLVRQKLKEVPKNKNQQMMEEYEEFKITNHSSMTKQQQQQQQQQSEDESNDDELLRKKKNTKRKLLFLFTRIIRSVKNRISVLLSSLLFLYHQQQKYYSYNYYYYIKIIIIPVLILWIQPKIIFYTFIGIPIITSMIVICN